MRKAQVTWFVILGVILLVALALFMFWPRSTAAIKSPMDDVQSALDDCLSKVLEESVDKVAYSGGYPQGIAYFVNGTFLDVPSRDVVERSVAGLVESAIPGCKPLLSQGLSLDRKGSPKAQVLLQNESVSATLDYLSSISNADMSRLFDKAKAALPKRLDEELTASLFIANEYQKTRKVDLTDLIYRNLTSTVTQSDSFIEVTLTDASDTRFRFRLS